VKGEGFNRRAIAPEDERLLHILAHAIAGRVMEREANVKAMALAVGHDVVDVGQDGFVDRKGVLGGDDFVGPAFSLQPVAVTHRDPHEVEAPTRDPAEVILVRQTQLAAAAIEILKIEAAPAR